MKSKEAIEAEINALEVKDDYGTKGEIKMLPNVLDEDETIKALSSGQKRRLLSGNLADILLVCTDKRVLMIDKGLLKSKTDEVALSAITSVERKDGIMYSKLVIRHNNGKPIKLKHIFKDAARAFCAEVQKGKETKVIVEQPSGDRKATAAEEIKELKELLDEGILTQEEFDAKKKQILNL